VAQPDFEDVVAWLAQRTDKTTIATLLRCSWKAVDNIVRRVVAEHLDTSRLNGLFRIGVDEISYKRGHYYLTIVADHDTGKVVWVAKGKRGQALQDFYDALGPPGRQRIEAVSMDLGTIYRDATRRSVPDAVICFDPFHVIQIANRALDAVFSASRHGADGLITTKQWRASRYALRAGAERLTDDQRQLLNAVRRFRYRLWRAWELKEGLRDLYRIIEPDEARPTCAAGSSPRPAAASPHSSTWPDRSGATSTGSSPLSNSACPTAASKASTAKSGSSNAAVTATTPSTPSPPPSTSASAGSPSNYPQNPEEARACSPN
jgi:hypothetical protein